MRRRKSNPWVTLFLFLAVCGLGWAGYEFVIVRQIFAVETKTFVPTEQIEEVRSAILDAYEEDDCLVDLGPLHYRSREKVYRIEIIVSDACHDHARRMCQEVSALVEDVTGRDAQVFALTEGYETITKYLP